MIIKKIKMKKKQNKLIHFMEELLKNYMGIILIITTQRLMIKMKKIILKKGKINLYIEEYIPKIILMKKQIMLIQKAKML